MIEAAGSVDRAGQAILEYIMCTEQRCTPTMGPTSIPELVAVTCWYIWWERRQATRGKRIQEPERSARAIDGDWGILKLL
jgi:hypothetical protein